MLKKLKADLAKVVCPLASHPDECVNCHKGSGCPDSWPDVVKKVDEIIAVLRKHGVFARRGIKYPCLVYGKEIFIPDEG